MDSYAKTVALRLSLLAIHQEIIVLNAYALSTWMLCPGTEPTPVAELWSLLRWSLTQKKDMLSYIDAVNVAKLKEIAPPTRQRNSLII